ncbi:hypothetical protein [Streptomyces sp. x-80]|uniref:hypothetical protein n=1 Tax=Streptomyces sp. x-80 TaxID=2789282 RepID=UPI00397F635A
MSRHGEPVLARHRIPSKHRRRSRGGLPVFGIGGNSGSSHDHWSSRLQPRPLVVRQISTCHSKTETRP